MKYEIRLGINAHRDLEKQLNYFDSVDDLRGRIEDFEDDLLAALELIAEHPFLRREIYPNVRHEALVIFKYHVWYRSYEQARFIDVFAILHQSVNRQIIEARLL